MKGIMASNHQTSTLRKYRIMLFMLVIGFFCFGHNVQAAATTETKTVLFLNSYHAGYKWSDDIYDGIKSALNAGDQHINLQVEYMDTQRSTDSQYLESLFETYQYKLKDRRYDLIIAADDTALAFLLDYGDTLFPGTPVVFCGVNYFQPDMLNHHALFTGVIEGFDIGATLDVARSLHPDTETIYYLVDDTKTGQSIMLELARIIPQYADQLNFVRLDGASLEQIINQVPTLPDNSLILYLVYFKDNAGNHFEYDEAISLLEAQATVPIYGVWDFSLGHGIIGGKLTSGFYQGKTAADIALRVLSGVTPAAIPVLTENTTYYGFDYRQIEKFKINQEALPPNSRLINAVKSSKRQVLILNSYDRSLKWTKDLEQSITARIGAEIDDVEFIYEDMDAKRNPDPVYLQNEYELLIRKHQNKQFDLIITTDDPAFNYVKKYHDTVYPDVPTIFSGVNYFEAAMIEAQPSFTGVVESNDLSGTIDTALAIDPGIKKIIVINDQTETGAANRKHLEQLLPDYQERLNIEIWDDFNMFEIQQKVSTLSADTVILLLSFNQDRSNNSFSYDESIELIAQAASVPIYGVWDFYLDHGLLGGALTSATSHGEMVGEMAVAVLNGQPPAAIPVVTASPSHAMFDAQILKKFDISPARLPKGSIVINQPDTLQAYLEQNKVLVMPFTVILLTLCGIVFLMYFKIKGKQAAEERERQYALTDPLTGMPNRRAGIEHLTRLLEKSRESDAQTTVCFIDVDKLKIVNDTWGHREGDQLINILCRLIQSKLRESDLCCRFGGDEFLIVFDNASIAEASQAMARIEEVIAAHNQNQTRPYEISISYGFAQYRATAETSVDDLIEQADKAMYQNKIRAREAASAPGNKPARPSP